MYDTDNKTITAKLEQPTMIVSPVMHLRQKYRWTILWAKDHAGCMTITAWICEKLASYSNSSIARWLNTDTSVVRKRQRARTIWVISARKRHRVVLFNPTSELTADVVLGYRVTSYWHFINALDAAGGYTEELQG